uniref:Ribosomal protein S1 n=1 Tax=Scinaia undulata TaxID=1884664 RepID=A0A1G4NXR3_9FLOR|nr:Ribosomal protein S1 [Scinaia undulata]SCW23483.1 Ribosomal protein S1 [Scinaia undulata]
MFFTQKNFAQVLSKYQYSFRTGDIIAGTIFSQEKEGYLIDVGGKNVAYLPDAEISLVKKYEKTAIINETREFFILNHNKKLNQIIVSLKRVKYIRAWDRIKQLKLEDIIIQAEIVGSNKGGLLIEIEEIQGFIPNSHLSYKINKKNSINQSIKCKLLIANEQTNQLILSNRCAVMANILSGNGIKVGLKIHASITEITDFGIFCNIHDIPALIHKSEIQNKYLQKKSSYFHIGKELHVIVRHIDAKQGRISISMLESSTL